LIGKGKEIVIIEESNSFGADIGATTKWGIISILKKAGVRMISAARINEITHRGVKVNLDGTEEFIEAGTVILAQGVKPNIELHKELEEKAPVLYRIGDCADFGRIREAISSGFEASCQV